MSGIARRAGTIACASSIIAVTTACGGRSPSIVVADVGFMTPESVLHDPDQDVYLVSNINGNPLDRDDNGFISRLSPDGEVLELKWIDGASPDVTLHAPKGMAVAGGQLYVADIDSVRIFDRRTGEPAGAWTIPGATFLNDVAVDGGGFVWVTDTGIRATAEGFEDTGTGGLFRFGPDGREVPILRNLTRPNGITWSQNKMVVVSFGPGEVFTVAESGDREELPKLGGNQLDGVVRLADGALIIADWETQALYRISALGTVSTWAESVVSPADIGLDGTRERILVPVFTQDQVVIFDI